MIYADKIKDEYRIEGNPRIVGEECKKILGGLYRRYLGETDDPTYAKGKILMLLLNVFDDTVDTVEWGLTPNEDIIEWGITPEEILSYSE